MKRIIISLVGVGMLVALGGAPVYGVDDSTSKPKLDRSTIPAPTTPVTAVARVTIPATPPATAAPRNVVHVTMPTPKATTKTTAAPTAVKKVAPKATTTPTPVEEPTTTTVVEESSNEGCAVCCACPQTCSNEQAPLTTTVVREDQGLKALGGGLLGGLLGGAGALALCGLRRRINDDETEEV